MIQEKTIDFEGIPVTYWEGGSGPALLMLHGSGPGASTHGNWRLILEPLAQHFHVLAADLVGFGKSGRKPQAPYFDFDLWVRQGRHMATLFGDQPVAVLGHSLSGAIALKMAALDPKITRVVTTGTMGTVIDSNPELERIWTFPETEDDLRQAAQVLVHDQSLIDDTYIEGRKKVLYDGAYKAYFSTMFAGDKSAYIQASVLSEDDLAAISCDVLLVHGRDDLPIPPQTSIELAGKLTNADLTLLANCSHSVALEHPNKLIGLIRTFL